MVGERHEHLIDIEFMENVSKIKNAKYMFKLNSLVSQFINFEETVVDCISYHAQKGDLNESLLGMFLNHTTTLCL